MPSAANSSPFANQDALLNRNTETHTHTRLAVAFNVKVSGLLGRAVLWWPLSSQSENESLCWPCIDAHIAMIAAALLLLLLLGLADRTLGSQQLAEPDGEAAIRLLEPDRPRQADRVTIGGPPVRCAHCPHPPTSLPPRPTPPAAAATLHELPRPPRRSQVPARGAAEWQRLRSASLLPRHGE